MIAVALLTLCSGVLNGLNTIETIKELFSVLFSPHHRGERKGVCLGRALEGRVR